MAKHRTHSIEFQRQVVSVPAEDLEIAAVRTALQLQLLLNLKPPAPPEFWGEVQPPASLKGLDLPSRRAVFVPWKPSRRPAFRMGNSVFR